MIGALIQGELIADPVPRTTSTGRVFVTATVRCAAGAESILIGLAAFEPVAVERLSKMHKGSSVAAAGVMEQNVWTSREGEERRGWRLAASEILTVREARRRRRRRDDAEGDE